MSAEWIVAILLAIVLVVVILFAAHGSRAWQRLLASTNKRLDEMREWRDDEIKARGKAERKLHEALGTLADRDERIESCKLLLASQEHVIDNLRATASAYETSRDVAVNQADGTRTLLAAVIARFVFDDVGLPVTYSLTAEEIETARPRRVFCHTNGATGEVTLSVQRAGATPSRGEFL